MNDNSINKFIEKGFERALSERTGEDFTAELLREIELTRVFRKEDKRTFGYFNFILIAIAGAVVTSGIALLVLLGSSVSEGGERTGTFGLLTNFFDSLNIKLYSLLGISFNENILFYFAGIAAAIALFTFLEKAVFKKGYN